MTVQDPTLYPDFQGWARAMVESFPDDEIGNYTVLDWRAWAVQLFVRPSFTFPIPDPFAYPDWRAWATALRSAAG